MLLWFYRFVELDLHRGFFMPDVVLGNRLLVVVFGRLLFGDIASINAQLL